jgi:hypothetical protein
MNRILAALLLLALSLPASAASVFTAPYGVQKAFPFEIWSSDGLTLDVDESDDGNDALVSCDGGDAAESANTYTDEGSRYQIVLTAAEMKCEYITVEIVEAVNTVFYIQTSARAPGVTTFGTAQSATATTIVLAAATSFPDNTLNCATILITGGTGAGQSRPITTWTSTGDSATVPTWTTNPDSTSVYEVYGTACATGDVNVEQINGVPVLGTGTSGDKWRGE